jgi:hypothetical protein
MEWTERGLGVPDLGFDLPPGTSARQEQQPDKEQNSREKDNKDG